MKELGLAFLEWFKGEFDKILLAGLGILCVIGALRASHHVPVDASLLDWLRQTASNIIGALLTLITGAALKSIRNGNGAPPPGGTK